MVDVLNGDFQTMGESASSRLLPTFIPRSAAAAIRMGNTPAPAGGAEPGSGRKLGSLSAASLSMRFKKTAGQAGAAETAGATAGSATATGTLAAPLGRPPLPHQQQQAQQQQQQQPTNGGGALVSDLSHISKPKPIGQVDRLMSCPDSTLRTEAEVVALLLRFFAYDVNENTPSENPSLRIFDNKSGVPPKITPEVYISRIIKYFHQVAEGVKSQGDQDVHSDMPVRYFVATIIYIDRMRVKTNLKLSPLNVHRLIISGVLMAAKVLDDLQPSLTWFSELGGLDSHELAELEVALLESLGYSVTIDPAIFSRRYQTVLGGGDFKEFDLNAHRKTPPV